MDMPPSCSLVPNQQQSSTPPCPGAAPCHPDAPHANPSHQGPLPCPQTPELCRPATGRAPGGHAHTEATPPDQEPPDRPRHAHATLSPPDTLPGPCRRRPARTPPPRTHPCCRGIAWPPVPPCLSRAAPAYKTPPLASTRHHTTSTTPSLHLEATEEQPELNSEPHGRHVVPPQRTISGDASGALTLPRPPAADPSPRRRPSPPAGSLPGHSPSSLPLSVLRSVGRKRTAVRRRSVDQRPQLFPACFETSEEIAKSWMLLL